MNDIVIWGAGRYGNLAYEYYKENFEIKYYIDSNEKRWGSFLNGIEIVGPRWVVENKCDVIVAIKANGKTVIDTLMQSSNVGRVIRFGINEESFECINEYSSLDQNERVVIKFGGGLGNQLFQYALYSAFEEKKVNVFADLANYKKPGERAFSVSDVFEKAKLNIITDNERKVFLESCITLDGNRKDLRIYEEGAIYDEIEKHFDTSILNMRNGYISGIFQTHIVADGIRGKLLEKLYFNVKSESGLYDISNKLSLGNYTSLHVRRGDYLSKYNYNIYSDICTKEYYDGAIKYIMQKNPYTRFVFFSNDIEWVKDNFVIREEDWVIEEELFDKYQDWYDMYLMSCCQNNIIANSTFSWWGAWLNQHDDKIVIAPERWVNGCDYAEICPDDWVRIPAKYST